MDKTQLITKLEKEGFTIESSFINIGITLKDGDSLNPDTLPKNWKILAVKVIKKKAFVLLAETLN